MTTPPRRVLPLIVTLLAAMLCMAGGVRAEEETKNPLEQPVIVNGDSVEYVTERSEITATGNVKVDYKGTKLSCAKLTVNTVTKDAVAEGSVVIENEKGQMRGERVVYNFNTKNGSVTNGKAGSAPYYCESELITMKGGNQFLADNGSATTCSYDHPHYRFDYRHVDIVANERIQSWGDTVRMGDTPILYLPYLGHSFDDRVTSLTLVPGYRKDWGPFLLSRYKFLINEDVSARVILDYRSRLGLAEGAGVNYTTESLGRGDAKVYYTDERPSSKEGGPGEFERWFARLRHRWDIDPTSDLMVEYYKISDEKRAEKGADWNFLREYFPREYEEDTTPPSYAVYHKTMNTASFDFSAITRSSKWYDQVERLPEARYTLPDIQITDGEHPLYFQDTTQVAYLHRAVTSPALPGQEYSAARADTYNQVTAPMRAGFVSVAPFAAMRNTAYSVGADREDVDPRTVGYTGISTSTKFYRTYETGPHYLGMDIDDIRHIITPTLDYTYNTPPTVKSWHLRQFDNIDAIGENSSFNLGLSNRLQTKREGRSVDLMNLLVTGGYIVYSRDPLTDYVTEGRLSDIVRTEFEFYPYKWLSVLADSDYNHKEGYFSTANADLIFSIDEGRRVGVGQRYARNSSSEFTAGMDWRLTPKWSFHTYERYQFKDNAPEARGSVRQEYGFTRDLHCWLMDITFSHEKENGNSVWIIFRLKAFPEAEVNFSQSYRAPHAGSN